MARKSQSPASYEENNSKPARIRKKFHEKDLLKIQPLKQSQETLFNCWEDDPSSSLFLYGSAGTGKTFTAMYLALRDVLSKQTHYNNLIIIRSTVPARDVGFLPGDLDEKIQVYEEPYASICDDLFKYKKSYENMKLSGVIRFMPTAFLRGTTFDNSIILVDEGQNMNFGELHTIMTRVGKNSKVIVCGDTKQCDLTYSKSSADQSGWINFIQIANHMSSFKGIQFDVNDIVRSNFVREWILASDDLII